MIVQLGLAQMQVEGGNKERNLEEAERMIAEAAHRGADIVLLPEALDLGWTHPASLTEAEPIPNGRPFQRLSSAAAENSVYVCAGLTELSHATVYNAAVLIDSSGSLLALHRKINELTIALPYYAVGDRLGVTHTKFGTIGLMICADGFAQGQVITRTLGYMGADFVLSPCSWAVRADHDNTSDPYGDFWRHVYQPPARDFRMPVAAVSNTGWLDAGPWDGKKCIGSSLVTGADGQDLFQAPYGPNADGLWEVPIETVSRPAAGHAWSEYWNRDRS